MPPQPDPHASLLNRSPRSRKSLAPVGAGSAPLAKRKRAHSIAPGENLKLDDSRRRSLMRPAKGILKPSNQSDDVTQDLTQAFPQLDDSNTTALPVGEYRTEVHDNTSRKSLGARRVSFAAHAHVRVFKRSQDQNTNGTSSPQSSSPVSSPASPEQQPDPPSPRRASLPSRRRSSVHAGYDDEGEESMDVSDDEIPAPSLPPHVLPRTLTPSPPDPVQAEPQPPRSDSDDSADDGDDGDMSMTGDFGAGIVARRRTMSMAGRRKSRMRSSIAGPPTETGEEPMEFTVALDRPPPPESDALKALREIANRGNTSTADTSAGEADMDVTTALTRLMKVRNSVGAPSEPAQNDSFSSTDDSFDGVDAGDHTLNVTNLMGSFRAEEDVDEEGDVTMSAASVVAAPIAMRRPSAAAPPPPASASASNARVPSPSKSTVPRAASPAKSPVKQFTAAFAPAHQSLKRPSSADPAPASPNKRRAVAVSDASTQRVPVPTQTESPKKGLPSRARRPSGYYRKSVGGGALPSEAAPPLKQLSASTSAPQRRQSMLPAPPKQTVGKPPPFVPRVPSQAAADPHCAKEAHRQSVALPSPTRGSPAPASPRRSPVQDTPSPGDAVGERPAEYTVDAPPALPSPTQGIDPGAWASAVQDPPQEDDLDPISVDSFFMMTGIRFMDDLTCPRRSTIHPSQLQRRESGEGETESYPLSDYAVAMAVDVAQLETMTWIANDIRSAIEKYKEQYRQTEDDAAKDIPLLFREFATAPEQDREQLLYVLKLIKAHTIGSAKASWYEWKRGWVQGLQTNAERTLDNLDADERQLEDIASRAGETLPSLRTEYEQIMQELEREQAAVAEIENCDQEFLSELKSTIAEQRQELDVFVNDIKDGKTKLSRLEETLEDLEDQARDAKTAISTAQRQMDMQKSSTRAEVFRLQDELRSLQDLHLWRATELSSDRVEFVYDSKYTVIIPCRRFTPIPGAVEVHAFNDEVHAKDDFPLVTKMMYRMARQHAIQDGEKLTMRMVIQRLTDFWASYAQLRWQLSFIIIKYPLSLQLLPAGANFDDAQGFKATATLLLFKKTSKAHISFYFDANMLCNWPMATPLLQYDVAVVYGNADSRVLSEAVKKRLSEVKLEENHACLVDACMEVVSQYS